MSSYRISVVVTDGAAAVQFTDNDDVIVYEANDLEETEVARLHRGHHHRYRFKVTGCV